MENKLTECFMAAAETLNFTSAAQRVHITQPAFSRNIALLEESYGFPLFWRSKKSGLRITPAGLVMYNGLRDLEAQRLQLLEKAQRITRGEEGKLVFGLLNGCNIANNTMQLIYRFQQLFPHIEFILKSYRYVELLPSVVSGDCDLCFSLDTAERNYPDLLHETMFSTKSYLVVPSLLNCDEEKTYSLTDFSDQVYLLSEDAPELNNLFVDSCRQAGFEPKTRMTSDYEAKMLLVELGQGVAVHGPDHYLRHSKFVQFLHVKELHDVDMTMVWHKENYNPAIALFYSMMDGA